MWTWITLPLSHSIVGMEKNKFNQSTSLLCFSIFLNEEKCFLIFKNWMNVKKVTAFLN